MVDSSLNEYIYKTTFTLRLREQRGSRVREYVVKVCFLAMSEAYSHQVSQIWLSTYKLEKDHSNTHANMDREEAMRLSTV